MPNRSLFLSAVFFVLLTGPVQGREIAGVTVPETVTLSDGSKLVLNGAGIREKFIFDIYVGALYLPRKAGTTKAVLTQTGARRVLMHFVYKEVERKKLVKAWDEGFAANTGKEELARLQSRLASFNSLFTTARNGDRILLDYLPATGTTVTINGKKRGTIPGKDFNDALLRVWLGDKPVTKPLKAALLGKD